MFSFQSEAINFLTNGKVTVKGLKQLGLITEGQCVIPNQFYESGWGLWLPMPNVTLVPYFSNAIAIGLSRDDTIIYLENKIKPNTFLDFEEAGITPTEFDMDEKQMLYEREKEIKRRLEANGYQYPKSINEAVSLYVTLGLAVEEVGEQGRICLDMLIRPLRKIDDVLIEP
ncbi:hypothetical protein SD70_32045 [Gordoniibacillus kamchatkensis]|uniref:Uncharacterized protein n=1 Tax=Gordoniibacillus kamchatkensis TaxID=1590651 RepID=A0ABR5A3L0_9BACL|nr:DUF6042 family protein [Paenibacillus sp. VKM B-2647]KIL35625.1 hypothetical protein SD70_32045 [Paenibacillus sp. VKM B-2647]